MNPYSAAGGAEGLAAQRAYLEAKTIVLDDIPQRLRS